MTHHELERRTVSNNSERRENYIAFQMCHSNSTYVRRYSTVKAKDQRRAMEMLDTDAGLKSLKRIEAPLFDMEIRGVPALQYMGTKVWD